MSHSTPLRSPVLEQMEPRLLLSGSPLEAEGMGLDLNGESIIKWEQPPEPANPDNVYLGWNEYSVHESFQIAADDWYCDTNLPVTGVVWWGSYLGWDYAEPPRLPDSFHMAIWTDVPAGVDANYSHPGQVIWEYDTRAAYTSDWVGWDFDPISETYESCFRFEAQIPNADWFYQEPDLNQIYWLSIAADYDDAVPPEYEFGWKTRPRDETSPAPDDAVRVFSPTTANVGDVYRQGQPIWWPTEDQSWDLAFELLTVDEPTTDKWLQAPDLDPTGMDVLAGPYARDPGGMDPYEKFLADDWLCNQTGAITQISFWGSYNFDLDLTPNGLPSFSLAIYSDIPAGVAAEYSMPGQLLWSAYLEPTIEEHYANAEELFYDPNYDEIIGQDTQVWLYTFDISEDMAFYQQEGTIYWLGVHHTYDLDGDGIVNLSDMMMLYEVWPGAFGWKTSEEHWNDDAVWTDVSTFGADPHVAPQTNAWRELRYPMGHEFAGQSIDLAFSLETTPEEGYKWEQKPDLNDTGIDVNATFDPMGEYQYVLADDFQCTQTGSITEITVWGSWYHDQYPGDPSNVSFTLSLHEDIPAEQSSTGYSMPGELLWVRDFFDGEFGVDLHAGGLHEGWMDPPDMYEPFGDTMCWEYTFNLEPGEFIQQGTPDEPVVYWLDVQAQVQYPGVWFGWKTSLEHWNDDAVWNRGQDPGLMMQWQELRYPWNHEMAGQSIDLAFRIEGEAEPQQTVKWSQPPEPYVPDDAYNGWDEYSVYGTEQIVADDWVCTTDAPVTDVHWWGSFLGWGELETPELPDAFHIGIWTDVPAGFDQPFSHPGEMLWENWCDTFTTQFVGWDFDPRDETAPPEATFLFEQDLEPEEWFWQEEGDNIYWVSISAVYENMWAEHPFGWKTRPRLNSPAPDAAVRIFDPTAPIPGDPYRMGEPIWDPTGLQQYDMAFALTTIEAEDWGDAPDAVTAVAYPTLRMSNGPRHAITPGMFLGSLIDGEYDGQPNLTATGDDNNNVPDEDGVVLTSALVPGQMATVNVTASMPGQLDAWVDMNGDNDWDDAGEQIFTNQPLAAGGNPLSFMVPQIPGRDVTYARWRYSSVGNLPYFGPAADGEVEDYMVKRTTEPGAPDLVAAYDTGQFNADNITNLDNSTPAKVLQFSVPGTVPGATVRVYSDGTEIGSAIAAGFSTLVTTNGSFDLLDGGHAITATQEVVGEFQSVSSPSLAIRVDTQGPVVSTPDLLAADDTGVASNDDITRGITPQFDGNSGDPLSNGYASGVWKVDVTSDDGASGTDTPGTPNYSVELATLSEGSRTVTATVYDVAGNSTASGGLAVGVDRTAPTATIPDLNAASDTGQSPNDDITQGTNPQFDGSANDPLSGGYASGVYSVQVDSDDGKTAVDNVSPFYSVVLPSLNEGVRNVRATVTDVAGNWILTGGLTVRVDRTAPNVSVPDLNPASDTGLYNNDDITQAVNPQFDGTASDPMSGGYASGVWRVRVDSDDGKSGWDAAAPFYSVTLATLAEGSRTVTAIGYDVAGNFTATGALALEADRSGPQITAFGLSSTWSSWGLGVVDHTVWTTGRTERTAACSNIDQLVVDFDEAVIAVSGDMSLVGASVGAVAFSGMTGSGTAQCTWTTTDYLDDDRYDLTVYDNIEDLAGNALDGEPHGAHGDTLPSGDGSAGGDWMFDLNVLAGDANGDGAVTDADYTIWADNYGSTSGNWNIGDFNGDGNVSDADYTIWADNYGQTLSGGGVAAVRVEEDLAPVLDVVETDIVVDELVVEVTRPESKSKRTRASVAPLEPEGDAGVTEAALVADILADGTVDVLGTPLMTTEKPATPSRRAARGTWKSDVVAAKDRFDVLTQVNTEGFEAERSSWAYEDTVDLLGRASLLDPLAA
jgi:GEVED domain-containing protein/Big-like domain-containing protein